MRVFFFLCGFLSDSGRGRVKRTGPDRCLAIRLEDQDWKVVTLANDYIEVYVLPEVGGKVWGAIEKSTGEEFIYRNEVMKFRNIAMRGPWTSGGIEFNFGTACRRGQYRERGLSLPVPSSSPG